MTVPGMGNFTFSVQKDNLQYLATNEYQFVSSGCWKATFSYPPNYILVILNESNTQLALKFPPQVHDPQVHPSATCVPT